MNTKAVLVKAENSSTTDGVSHNACPEAAEGRRRPTGRHNVGGSIHTDFEGGIIRVNSASHTVDSVPGLPTDLSFRVASNAERHSVSADARLKVRILPGAQTNRRVNNVRWSWILPAGIVPNRRESRGLDLLGDDLWRWSDERLWRRPCLTRNGRFSSPRLKFSNVSPKLFDHCLLMPNQLFQTISGRRESVDLLLCHV
jgi:hypothetical protein